MNCPSCRHVNAPDRNFCGACGAPLAAYCSCCGFRNRAADRYCGGCGRALGEAAAVEESAVAAGGPAPPQDELGELLVAAQEAVVGGAEGEDVRVTQDDIDQLFGD